MFKPGDIVLMDKLAPYSITKPGTRWMVYSFNEELRIGTLPQGDYTPQDMVRLYGGFDSRTINRRYEANVRIFNVSIRYCKIEGNNALFKNKLFQGDMWDEENNKQRTWSRGKGYFTEGIEWEDIFKSRRD